MAHNKYFSDIGIANGYITADELARFQNKIKKLTIGLGIYNNNSRNIC